MNFETPLHKVEGTGSAKSGSRHWLAQRTTAAALFFFGLWFVMAFLIHFTAPYSVASEWLTSPWNASFAILFMSLSFYHGYLGLQVIWEDYVPHLTVRWVLILLSKYLSIGLGLASVLSILKVYIG